MTRPRRCTHYATCIVIALSIYAIVSQAVSPYAKCRNGVRFDQYSTSYSLSGLTLPFASYNGRDIVVSTLYYRYNLCAPVPVPPPSCPESATKVSAFQIQMGDEETCTALTSNGDTELEFELYDPNNPAAGFVIKHGGGDMCKEVNSEKYSFVAKFICSDKPQSDVNRQFIVPEDECTMSVVIESRKACPVQCPVDPELGLCSGMGVCGYDADQKTSRCFCYSGRSGAQCEIVGNAAEDQGSDGLNATQTILVVVTAILALLLALALTFYCYLLRVRITREVPSATEDASQLYESNFNYAQPNDANNPFDAERTVFSA